MNRTDSKCARQQRYPALAEAQAKAKASNGIYQAHGCECGGFHVSKVKRTPQEDARAANDELYGDYVHVIRAMIRREVRVMKRAGLRRRKPHRAEGRV